MVLDVEIYRIVWILKNFVNYNMIYRNYSYMYNKYSIGNDL